MLKIVNKYLCSKGSELSTYYLAKKEEKTGSSQVGSQLKGAYNAAVCLDWERQCVREREGFLTLLVPEVLSEEGI